MPKKFESLVTKGDFDPLLEDLKDSRTRKPAAKPKPRPRLEPKPAPKPAPLKAKEENVVELSPAPRRRPAPPAPERLKPTAKAEPKKEPAPRNGERLPTRTAQFDRDFNRELTSCLQRIGQHAGLTGLPYNVSARIASMAFQHAEAQIIEEIERSGELDKLGTRPANQDEAALAEWEDLWTKTVFAAWRRMRPWN